MNGRVAFMGRSWLVATSAVVLLAGAAAPARAQATADTAYVPAEAFPNGREIVAVYFGASWCGPCRKPEMKAAVRRMKVLISNKARQSGESFSAMAVVLDRDFRKGLDFVAPLGQFDEYSFGSDLVSTAAQRYVWGDSASKKNVAVPFVLVFERTIDVHPPHPIVFGADHVLKRIYGDSIPTWVSAGAPIR